MTKKKYTIIVNRVTDHDKHKINLLDKIDLLKKEFDTKLSSRDCYSNESWTESPSNVNSDWALPRDTKREYLDYFYSEIIPPIMRSIASVLGFKSFDWEITNGWFQQYFTGGEHSWHNHTGAQFTNCYYLELPNDQYKTEIIGSDGKIIKFNAKEGDVVTMPAWMIHRSKPNGIGRKTAIAFNSSYIYKE